jgi:diguanylate cyclase (GGDEF)-like protein
MIRQHLHDLVASHEDWLMNRVLHHARTNDYTKYTSTLAEAWRMSIHGLSESLMRAIEVNDNPPEFGPDENFAEDPTTSFGILEARRHRSRGVTLSMFLGLMKYYRQSYVDLVMQAGLCELEEDCRLFIERFFDRVEIGFAVEWSTSSEDEKIKQLQVSNRAMTNEKNKYLTIFESTPSPVIFVDAENRIDDMNHAASELIYGAGTPGSTYYGEKKTQGALPWKIDEIAAFLLSNDGEHTFKKALETQRGIRYFEIKLKRMLDVSHKFNGVAIILNDITETKELEDRLSAMSVTDELTGLYNRRGFIALTRRQMKITERSQNDMLLFFADLDKMKYINDTLGHKEGDRALIEVATILKAVFRESDIIGRIGGDEFAILATNATDKTGEALMNRLQELLDRYNRSAGRKYELSLSTGMTRYDPKSRCSPDELMAEADAQMYEEKRRKQNREPSFIANSVHRGNYFTA